MADGQTTLFAPPPEHDHARLRAHEADFTPLGVIRQFFAALDEQAMGDFHLDRVRTFLDLTAGAGAYGLVAREALPNVEQLVAIEAREEERPHLERHFTEVHVGDTLAIMQRFADEGRRFDLIATNPPFSLITRIVPLAYELLQPRVRSREPSDRLQDGHLALLCRTQAFQAAEHYDFMREWCPFAQLRVGGRVKFRTGLNPKNGKPYGADSCDYSHLVWDRWGLEWLHQQLEHDDEAANTPRWETHQLPPLPAEDRAWTIRPGTEEA